MKKKLIIVMSILSVLVSVSCGVDSIEPVDLLNKEVALNGVFNATAYTVEITGGQLIQLANNRAVTPTGDTSGEVTFTKGTEYTFVIPYDQLQHISVDNGGGSTTLDVIMGLIDYSMYNYVNDTDTRISNVAQTGTSPNIVKNTDSVGLDSITINQGTDNIDTTTTPGAPINKSALTIKFTVSGDITIKVENTATVSSGAMSIALGTGNYETWASGDIENNLSSIAPKTGKSIVAKPVVAVGDSTITATDIITIPALNDLYVSVEDGDYNNAREFKSDGVYSDITLIGHPGAMFVETQVRLGGLIEGDDANTIFPSGGLVQDNRDLLKTGGVAGQGYKYWLVPYSTTIELDK